MNINESVAPEVLDSALSKRAEKKEAKKEAKLAGKKSTMAADSRPVNAAPMISTEPPSGTRDFFPEDMRLRTWLFSLWRETAQSFGFQEYDAPVLESEDLYKRKAGEEITDQMYNFIDKEGAKVTLRPEMTPTLVRMVLSRMRTSASGPAIQMADVLPLKWYSLPQCWRFETTQRGRKREHFQWNCDINGVQGITAEMELLACTVAFFKSVGLTPNDVGVRVNSRRILGAALDAAGVSNENFAKVCVIVDKIDKVGEAEVIRQLMVSDSATTSGPGLDSETAKKVVGFVNKNFTLDTDPSLDGVAELKELFSMAAEYEIADWLVFDASVVRGLAYYTGVVWEAFDKKGVLRAIAGGGRYDELFSLYGAQQRVPCVGFGFGDCVIVELLKERGLLPSLSHGVDFVVASYPGCFPHGLKVAAALRAAGARVDVALEPGKKVANVFKYADKMGARAMAFVAPSEWAEGKVRVKDLRGGQEGERKEKDVSLDEMAGWREWFSHQ